MFALLLGLALEEVKIWVDLGFEEGEGGFPVMRPFDFPQEDLASHSATDQTEILVFSIS